jgi:16S rRNA (uracil1498-N3)-methyltransferase
MQLFYHPDLSESLITVSPEESRHISVLRLKPGESIYLTNGEGLLCKAIIADSSSKACQLQIMERYPDYKKRSYYLHIAIAPTKQMERLEWFLEKATEIGVDEITPVICKHAERKEVKTERLYKIMQSAMKQSLKAYLPRLNEAVAFETFVKSADMAGRFIASGQAQEKDHLQNYLHNHKQSLVLIGPEGDFTESELKMSADARFKPVSLGPNRLRTETAGVYVSVAASLSAPLN